MPDMDDYLYPNYSRMTPEENDAPITESNINRELLSLYGEDLIGLITIDRVIVPFTYHTSEGPVLARIIGITRRPNFDIERCLVLMPRSVTNDRQSRLGWWRLADPKGIKLFAYVNRRPSEILISYLSTPRYLLRAADLEERRIAALGCLLTGLSSGSKYTDVFQELLGQFESDLKLNNKFYTVGNTSGNWVSKHEDKVWRDLEFSDLLRFVGLIQAK